MFIVPQTRVQVSARIIKGVFQVNSIKKNSMTELRRDELLQRLIDQGIYKVDGRQLFELSFYELLKLYTASQETA